MPGRMCRVALLAAVALLAWPASGGTATGIRLSCCGDSLALGTAPYLPGLLRGWHLRQVAVVVSAPRTA